MEFVYFLVQFSFIFKFFLKHIILHENFWRLTIAHCMKSDPFD